ncbi:MAG: dephospho-CoA kinase [Deltaproteobacteria bacterium]|nr:dephospho-CoA kinase [Deltaproteobacteria bacterium]MBW2660660.1 dephospho-CoA kinase [Deltaproteobacteria bacterium]
MSKIKKVAVTGSAGSGKTIVCGRFQELGLRVINSDILAREVVSPGSTAYKEIINFFGKKVLNDDATLNRRMIRRMIIHDDTFRKVLEQFTHPEIIKLMKSQITAAEKDGNSVVVVEVPLLFEFDMESLFDEIIVVIAKQELRITRLMNRDYMSRSDAQNLLNIQMPDEEKVQHAAFLFQNNGSVKQLIKSVDIFYKNFLLKYEKKI